MLSLTALLVTSSLLILASCKKPQGEGTAKTKSFNVEYIKVWTSQVKDGNVEVAGGSPKEVEVKVTSCKKLTAEVGGQRGTGTNGKVIIQNVNIMKGNSTLTLKLTAKGFEDETFDIGVSRKDTKKPFSVAIVAATGESPSPVLKGQMVETTLDQTEVVVTAKFAMTEVKINETPVTLANEKEARLSVPAGKVDVSVTFADYESDAFTFNIQKVKPTERSIACTNVKLSTEKYKDGVTGLSFDGNRKLEWEANGDDIQYSYVTVEMEFDVDINKPTIICKDERSEKYSSSPTEQDMRGVFSGYITKEPGAQGLVEVNPISGKKYEQIFIVAAGKVTYDLEFEAKNSDRKKTKYTIEIDNKHTEKFMAKVQGKEVLYPRFNVLNYKYTGYLGNAAPTMHLPSYHKGPLYDDKGIVTENLSDLEAIDGALEFVPSVWYKKADAQTYEKNKDFYFYFSTGDTKDDLHKFARVKSRSVPFNDMILDLIPLRIGGLNDKYFDGFAAFRNYLPQGIHPLYTKNKWKEKGVDFVEPAIAAKSEGIYGAKDGTDIYGYRDFADFLKKAQNSSTSSDAKLEYRKKMNGKFWINGEKKELNSVLSDDGNDLFMLDLLFDISKVSAKYTIKSRGSSSVEFTEINEHKEKTLAICENKSAQGRLIGNFFMAGVTEKEKVEAQAYKFTKDKIYEVTFEVKNDSNTYKYVFILDYVTTDALDVELKGADEDDSSSLFGVPTYYSRFPMEKVNLPPAIRQEFLSIAE